MPAPLRLTAVSSYLGLGGSTTFLVNLGAAFRALPAQLQIIGLGPEPALPALAEVGAWLHPNPPAGLIYEDRLAWAYRHLAHFRPHAVLACLGSASFELLRLTPPGVARLGVIQAHEEAPYTMARGYTAELQAIIGVSAQIAAQLREPATPPYQRVAEIPYGIQFPPAPPRTPPPAGTPLRVLYLGRIAEEQKRISRVIDVIRHCAAAELPLHFTIAGDGPEAPAAQAALAHLPNIAWHGPAPYSEVPTLLRQHQVLLLLSDYEGLPLSLLEAMGEGVVPVVSESGAGILQAVPDGTGLRLPVGDLPATLQALQQLAEKPALLAQLSAAAQAHARTAFSAQRMAESYLQLATELSTYPAEPTWPAQVEIPAPRFVPCPWLYRGLPRRLRRLFKR